MLYVFSVSLSALTEDTSSDDYLLYDFMQASYGFDLPTQQQQQQRDEERNQRKPQHTRRQQQQQHEQQPQQHEQRHHRSRDQHKTRGI